MKMPQKNIAEWTVFGFSLLLVLSMIGFLATQISEANDEPAQLTVEFGQAEPRNGNLVVPLTLNNEGDATAEDIMVEVILTRPDATPEAVELTFARLARREMAEGEAVFSGEASGSIEAQVRSYSLP